MLAWLKQQAELSLRAAAEAEALIARVGDEEGYQEARSRVGGTRDCRPPDLYSVRVRREIARRRAATMSIPPRVISNLMVA
jgi:hypothetical protein